MPRDESYCPEPPFISRGLTRKTPSLMYGYIEREVAYIERGLLW